MNELFFRLKLFDYFNCPDQNIFLLKTTYVCNNKLVLSECGLKRISSTSHVLP